MPRKAGGREWADAHSRAAKERKEAMTWKEIRDECLKLMYSYSKKGSVVPASDGNLKDYILAMPGAANIALYDIARALPDIRKYTVEQEESEAAQEYDMRELTKQDGRIVFMRFADKYADGGVPCAILPDGHTLWVDGAFEGRFHIYYHAAPEEFTDSTPDDYVPELPPGAANLIPFCMASSLFKDDDASIASMLWNEYAQRLEALWSDAVRAGETEYVCTTGWI